MTSSLKNLTRQQGYIQHLRELAKLCALKYHCTDCSVALHEYADLLETAGRWKISVEDSNIGQIIHITTPDDGKKLDGDLTYRFLTEIAPRLAKMREEKP